MSKSFDKILVRRIREVFDNHREEVDPDAWRDMERRLNRRNRVRVVYIKRIAGAAALLLLLMLLFRPFESRRDTVPSMDQIVQSESENASDARSPQGSAESSESQGPVDERASGSQTLTASKAEGAGAGNSPKESGRRSEASLDKGVEDAGNLLIAGQPGRQSQNRGDIRVFEEMGKKQVLITGISPSEAGEPADSNPLPGGLAGPGETKALTAQLNQPGSDHASVWENLPAPSASRDKKSMELEVEFSTLYNYSSTMVASEVNFAGGVISEFQVLPDLKVSTGLVVSRQYFTTSKQSQGLTAYLSANSSYSQTDNVAHIDENHLDGVYPQFRDVSNKVKLIGLDVPVNIEYRIDKVSLSAGISSFTYLQEKYRHDFTSNYVVYEYDKANNLVGTNKVAQNESVKETYDPLGKMDLASVLNVAVGYHFDLGQTRLVVEPFMKHPLGDLASRDIRFGARGLRLRLGF